jgi:hypothetical protein
MTEIVTQGAGGAFAAGGFFIGILVHLFDRWYFTKGGKAKLQEQEAEIRALRDQLRK